MELNIEQNCQTPLIKNDWFQELDVEWLQFLKNQAVFWKDELNWARRKMWDKKSLGRDLISTYKNELQLAQDELREFQKEFKKKWNVNK